MPKLVKPLTELQVKNLKPKQKPDGTLVKNMQPVGGCPNLYCCIKPSGSKSWILRPLIGNKRPEIGLGTYSGGKATRKKRSTGDGSTGMTLSAARQAGLKMLDDIAAGIDPLAEKRRKRSEAAVSKAENVTFSDLAKEYVAIKTVEWKTVKQVSRLEQFLRDYINPVVGNILVSELEPAHFIAVLKPKIASLEPLDALIFDILDAGFFDNLTPIDLTNGAFIRTEQIRDKYLEWHPNAQRFKPVTDKYITSHVMRVFPSARRDQQRVGVDNRRGLIWPPLDACRQDFEKYLNCKILWADASEVPKKHAASVTSVTDESEAAFVNTFEARQEHISEAEQLQ